MFAVRIAFLTSQWPGVRMSGIGAAVRQNALAMAAAGHDVHVFTLMMPADADRPSALQVHEADDLSALVNRNAIPAAAAASVHAGGAGVYRLSTAWRLCQSLIDVHHEQPFDVVESPEVEALGLPLLINGEFAAPVITQLHCCTALAASVNRSSPASSERTLAVLEFAVIHLADGVIAPTRAVIGATREFTPVRDDAAVIPHCWAESTNFCLPNSGPLVFVGRLERLKGVETIAEALNLFLPKHPEAGFRFIGPDTSTAPDGGSMRDHLVAILNAGIRDRVEFTGEVSPSVVADAWRTARFGVMPSIWENFSLAACEAMSHGRTLIVADGTGSVELVGDAGLVVPQEDAAALADAMNRLWDKSQLLSQLSRGAYDRINTIFAPSRVARQREAYYADLIKRFDASDRRERLKSVPVSVAAEVLPALVRMTGSLSACPSATAQTPGARLLNIMSRIEDEQGHPARLMLYGAGKHTARLMSERHLWESRRHRIVGIIDDHPRFAQTPIYLDVPVQSMNAAAARVLGGEKLPPVVLSTDTYADQFWRQSAALRAAGVQVFRLY